MRFHKSLFLLLLLSSFVQAQNAPSVEKHQFKINVLLPGFVYEYGINNKNTLYSELSAGFGYSSSGFGENLSFYPYIQEQFRHYYNLEKTQKYNIRDIIIHEYKLCK